MGLNIPSTPGVDLTTNQSIAGIKTFTGGPSIQTLPLDLQIGQIAFPGTANPSGSANTLDDYEEGTFTPTVFGTSTAGAGTYSLQEGSYIKIGSLVYFTARIAWSAHTGTGNMRFGGLPFTVSAVPGFGSMTLMELITFTAGYFVSVYPIESSTNIDCVQNYTGVSAAGVPIDTSGGFFMGGCYKV